MAVIVHMEAGVDLMLHNEGYAELIDAMRTGRIAIIDENDVTYVIPTSRIVALKRANVTQLGVQRPKRTKRRFETKPEVIARFDADLQAEENLLDSFDSQETPAG